MRNPHASTESAHLMVYVLVRKYSCQPHLPSHLRPPGKFLLSFEQCILHGVVSPIRKDGAVKSHHASAPCTLTAPPPGVILAD